jgi:hypothetical protein
LNVGRHSSSRSPDYCLLKDGGGYDLVITDNKTAPNIPFGGKMEAIA